MLIELHKFLYQIKNIAQQSFTKEKIYEYMLNFKKKFTEQNKNVDMYYLEKMVKIIIIMADEILINNMHNPKEWVNNTGEYKLFNSNLGEEIFQDYVNEIIDNNIFQPTLIEVAVIAIEIGLRTPRKDELIHIYKEHVVYTVNLQPKDTFRIVNTKVYWSFYKICGGILLIFFLLNEGMYYFAIKQDVKSTQIITSKIRRIYGSI